MYIPSHENNEQNNINIQYTYFMSTIYSQEQICIFNCLIFMWISIVFILYEYFETWKINNKNIHIKFKFN
jgi:hypothetical protein